MTDKIRQLQEDEDLASEAYVPMSRSHAQLMIPTQLEQKAFRRLTSQANTYAEAGLMDALEGGHDDEREDVPDPAHDQNNTSVGASSDTSVDECHEVVEAASIDVSKSHLTPPMLRKLARV